MSRYILLEICSVLSGRCCYLTLILGSWCVGRDTVCSVCSISSASNAYEYIIICMALQPIHESNYIYQRRLRPSVRVTMQVHHTKRYHPICIEMLFQLVSFGSRCRLKTVRNKHIDCLIQYALKYTCVGIVRVISRLFARCVLEEQCAIWCCVVSTRLVGANHNPYFKYDRKRLSTIRDIF